MATEMVNHLGQIERLVGYDIVDCKTGQIIKSYGQGKRSVASRYADRLDSRYGAYRYMVRPIWKIQA